jgi:putative sterol carrier protein
MREIIAKMVIDDKSYAAASPPTAQTDTDPVQRIYETLSSKGQSARPLGKTLNFQLEDQVIHVDGTGPQNLVSLKDQPADCTIRLSPADFQDILEGRLNPMNAMMGGKIQLDGDISVAMQLQNLLG